MAISKTRSIFDPTNIKTITMTNKQITKLVEKDFNEFRNQFGTEKLNQIIKSGNLPLRRETLEKIRNTKQMRKIDFSKFV